MLGGEISGTVAGISSGGFADERGIVAFFHIHDEAFGGGKGLGAGQQIDSAFIGICFGLHDLAFAEAMRLFFPDEVFADVPPVTAAASSVLADIYDEVGQILHLGIGS